MPTTVSAASAYTIRANGTLEGNYYGAHVDFEISIAVVAADFSISGAGGPYTFITNDPGQTNELVCTDTNGATVSAPDISYSVSPTLPTGLSIDQSTGRISGTSTTEQASQNYTITATGQNSYSGKSANVIVNITINGPDLSIHVPYTEDRLFYNSAAEKLTSTIISLDTATATPIAYEGSSDGVTWVSINEFGLDTYGLSVQTSNNDLTISRTTENAGTTSSFFVRSKLDDRIGNTVKIYNYDTYFSESTVGDTVFIPRTVSGSYTVPESGPSLNYIFQDRLPTDAAITLLPSMGSTSTSAVFVSINNLSTSATIGSIYIGEGNYNATCQLIYINQPNKNNLINITVGDIIIKGNITYTNLITNELLICLSTVGNVFYNRVELTGTINVPDKMATGIALFGQSTTFQFNIAELHYVDIDIHDFSLNMNSDTYACMFTNPNVGVGVLIQVEKLSIINSTIKMAGPLVGTGTIPPPTNIQTFMNASGVVNIPESYINNVTIENSEFYCNLSETVTSPRHLSNDTLDAIT
jgi:hypothetical protein